MLTESEFDASVWPRSTGGWVTDRRNAEFVLTPQPWVKNDRASRLVRDAGVKRIRYGYFYRISVRSDDFGCFTPVLLSKREKEAA